MLMHFCINLGAKRRLGKHLHLNCNIEDKMDGRWPAFSGRPSMLRGDHEMPRESGWICSIKLNSKT